MHRALPIRDKPFYILVSKGLKPYKIVCAGLHLFVWVVYKSLVEIEELLSGLSSE